MTDGQGLTDWDEVHFTEDDIQQELELATCNKKVYSKISPWEKLEKEDYKKYLHFFSIHHCPDFHCLSDTLQTTVTPRNLLVPQEAVL